MFALFSLVWIVDTVGCTALYNSSWNPKNINQGVVLICYSGKSHMRFEKPSNDNKSHIYNKKSLTIRLKYTRVIRYTD